MCTARERTTDKVLGGNEIASATDRIERYEKRGVCDLSRYFSRTMLMRFLTLNSRLTKSPLVLGVFEWVTLKDLIQ